MGRLFTSSGAVFDIADHRRGAPPAGGQNLRNSRISTEQPRGYGRFSNTSCRRASRRGNSAYGESQGEDNRGINCPGSFLFFFFLFFVADERLGDGGARLKNHDGHLKQPGNRRHWQIVASAFRFCLMEALLRTKSCVKLPCEIRSMGIGSSEPGGGSDDSRGYVIGWLGRRNLRGSSAGSFRFLVASRILGPNGLRGGQVIIGFCSQLPLHGPVWDGDTGGGWLVTDRK